jgi:hypothetical protein
MVKICHKIKENKIIATLRTLNHLSQTLDNFEMYLMLLRWMPNGQNKRNYVQVANMIQLKIKGTMFKWPT